MVKHSRAFFSNSSTHFTDLDFQLFPLQHLNKDVPRLLHSYEQETIAVEVLTRFFVSWTSMNLRVFRKVLSIISIPESAKTFESLA